MPKKLPYKQSLKSSFQKKILKLDFKTFLKTIKYAPRVAVNLLVKDQQGQILFTKRAKEPFKGYWHFPGTFIFKGETLMDCLFRLAREELGLDIKDNLLKLGSTSDTKELKFFKSLPKKIGFNHRETLKKLLNSRS